MRFSLLLLSTLLLLTLSVRVEKGWITVQVTTGDSTEQHKVEYNSRIKQSLTLTQSSKIKITPKFTFSADDFLPEFLSFRLRHPQHDNLSEPVLATFDHQTEKYQALIDLGDPKHIQHFSGNYQLELILSDDRLEQQIRSSIANCQISFRHSLEQPQPHELKYVPPHIIMTEAPATRVDPPALFTGFVVVLISVLFGLFLLGLHHLKVNLNLFPAAGTGLLLNVVFLGSLGLVLVMLAKFWLSWTFIETIQCFLITILPISLAANYAFVHIKKN